jgi:hydroxymethylpyrimidine pyrophosphatase-like HAD family hydrolase
VSENLEEQRLQKFRDAVKETYAGCAFDVDGTLTVRGEGVIPAYLYDVLERMCMIIPMAICSGRRLMSVYEKLAPIFSSSGNPEYCQSNWVFICENGSLGYYFDTSTKKYQEFYRIPYPYDENHRERLFSDLSNLLKDKISDATKDEIGLVFHPFNAHDPDHAAAAKTSHEVAEIISSHLSKADPKRALKIGDSGIGVNVFPYAGDKEYGFRQFGKFLSEKRGIALGEKLRELVVIGDRPVPNGNDEAFLQGNFGTPFTVGEAHPVNVYPLPVFDESGKILQGPEGTAYLLNNLKFKNT